MIHVGLTGWGDHDSLYLKGASTKNKLEEYSAHFTVVELDASFYAIQPERNITKWIRETPEPFQFVVKGYQEMTGHHRGQPKYDSVDDMYNAFRLSIDPLNEAGKLAMVLMQFPPWFDCQKAHVDQLRFVREKLKNYDVAIEFRHQSWYEEPFLEKTIEFLTDQQFIHSVCDEPQAGDGSIPFIPIATNSEKTLVRLHGRNVAGWNNPGGDPKKWREVRYLYDYNKKELEELKKKIDILDNQSDEVVVMFNNNSGGHAANNAKQFQQIANIEAQGLASKQLDLFEGEW